MPPVAPAFEDDEEPPNATNSITLGVDPWPASTNKVTVATMIIKLALPTYHGDRRVTVFGKAPNLDVRVGPGLGS